MNIDNNNLSYRKLDHNDMELFIKLRLDFINEFHKDIDKSEKEKITASVRSYFERHINTNEFIGIVCEYNKNAVSTAFLIVDEWPANRKFINGKVGTLLNVFTYPEYRKKGIGANVIKRLLDEAKKEKISMIDLRATKDGENIYRMLGFSEPEDKSMRLIIKDE